MPSASRTSKPAFGRRHPARGSGPFRGPAPEPTHVAKSPAGRGICSEIRKAYHILYSLNGNLHWWPGNSRLEIIIGAILTQNTAWQNVEKAIARMKTAGLLSLRSLRRCRTSELEEAIRPSGYFRQKARKIKAFIEMLDHSFAGSLAKMAREETPRLREVLLGTWGIGSETADSILLYAFSRPIFVIDAYTIRVATRHGWMRGHPRYDEAQALFERCLPRDVALFNDYHAQMVWVGKHYCRSKPRCGDCPLSRLPMPESTGDTQKAAARQDQGSH